MHEGFLCMSQRARLLPLLLCRRRLVRFREDGICMREVEGLFTYVLVSLGESANVR
jgi:hypothetical protein